MTMTMTTITNIDTPPPMAAMEVPPDSTLELELMIFTVCFEDKNKKKPYINTKDISKIDFFNSSTV